MQGRKDRGEGCPDEDNFLSLIIHGVQLKKMNDKQGKVYP